MCALQLFQNMTCNKIDVCRIDLNLSCAIDCYGATSTTSNVTTAVGSCNGSCTEILSENLTTLHVQAGIFVASNGTLYVADGLPVNKIFTLEPNQQIGQPLITFADWPTFIYVENKTSNIYTTVRNLNSLQAWPSNATIPPSGITGSCTLNKLSELDNFVFDSFAQWAPNATNGTLVAGSPLGTLGNFTGVTIAGGNGAGSASNQLNRPTTWTTGASSGITIAGSVSGLGDSTLYLLNLPYDIWIDLDETYLLI
ncbi:unnamed protein product [Rotaria magnacalcarata]|uniref:Uncharacterized protein n=2 Tax=Rotaria magnacalcarata TaxID=392030 RepID=A0A819HQW7_9BILA|nr:unnamed protein product [Rotaria magnacalcarata]CAF4333995.1 unnamed protein product [Rotaria magnacalcarata]